ncbi:NUDIX domain-containing protein [Streptomyces sp. NBC_00024]|uniref:NUDIX domain-containing protein n=1 Tax=Streptomyces sp. NBC_00024 TaxID=2903612 RepID=UPI003244BA63
MLHDTGTGPSGGPDCAAAGCGGAGEGAGEACAPCVAALATPQDRLEAVRAALASEAEPLVALTHLLHLCRDQHAELWERIGDPDGRHRVNTALEPLTGMLAARAGATTVDPALGRALADALVAVEGVPAVVVARALAELLDEHFADTFTASFSRRSPYRPGVGDPIPLDAPDLRGVTRMPPTAPPWRLANRLDETRHVRLAGDWAVQFRVVFDYSLYDVLSGLVTAETVVATCHPNRTMEELVLPKDTEGRTFPVRPADPARQYQQIDRLIGRAAAAGAAVVVLPELSVTASLARRLRAWVQRPDGPRLLVTGSYHHQDAPGGEPARRRRHNTALVWVRGHDQPLLHDKHSPADRPVVEDIQPQGWPEQRVYVLADGWHLVIAICRDLLNPEAVHTLAEAGANLVLVPAMSESLTAFGGPAAHLVGARQALVAVANNPGQWPDALRAAGGPARALFGHPGFARQTRLVHTPDPGPGVALLTVGSGQIAWLDDPAGPTARGAQHGTQTTAPAPPHRDEPGWLAPLTAHLLALPTPGGTAPERIPLRPAAVLVLLTDSGTGPRVLLTERTGDLGDYPGKLVYPGGAAHARDAGPAATALREAHEETGLDPDSVQVIGALPAFALPDSGFLVTPVLAWSAAPAFSAGINTAEVRALGHVRLTEVACGGSADDHNDHADGPASAGVMTAAVADLLTGMLTRVGHGARPSDDARATARQA